MCKQSEAQLVSVSISVYPLLKLKRWSFDLILIYVRIFHVLLIL